VSFTVVLVSDVLDTTAPGVRTFAGCVVGAVVGTVVLPLLASSLSVPLSLSVVVSPLPVLSLLLSSVDGVSGFLFSSSPVLPLSASLLSADFV